LLVASVEPARLRIRLEAYAPGPLAARINGKTLKATDFSADKGFQEIVIPIPGGAMRAGENKLELLAKGTALVDGRRRSFAIDWMRLEPSARGGALLKVSPSPKPAPAAQGTLFERPQAPANWTNPSVASVLTSLYPSSHHVQSDAAKLSDSITMVSEVYQHAGFKTASFITNSFVSPQFGFDQGWDLTVNKDYLADSDEGKAAAVFAAASDWIAKNHDERFFLYIQTIDPHVPYDPPAKYIEMYDPKPYDGQVKNEETAGLLVQVNRSKVYLTERDKERVKALYDGEVTCHDTELAHFLAKMHDLGLDENTIMVVVADHGEEFGEHGQWGHGHSVYQSLLHVPLIFRWPGVISAGARIDPVVSIIDIEPTVLEATGVPAPAQLEGRSLMGFMRGDWPRGPYVAFSEWKSLSRVIRAHDWKLTLQTFSPPALYDLRNDPDEQKKLDSAEHPIAQRYLRTLIGQFLGTPDPAHWLAPAESTTASPEKHELHEEKQTMTPELCRQLTALGYVVAECKGDSP